MFAAIRLLFIAFAVSLLGQENSRESLNVAYQALQQGRLIDARAAFEEALQSSELPATVRLDYAYLLLRMGETELGRDQLQQVLEERPGDERLALEYAYLAYETGRRAKAFELFLRLRQAKDEAIRKSAAETFERLDAGLQAAIARWREAAERNPESYSVHEELGRRLEDRNDWVAAADAYRKAFALKPDKRRFLLDIARVEREALRPDLHHAALIAASRGEPPMVAEEARELLPNRYPYVYEFELAISLDPLNVPLRRELGFLLLKMGRERDAVPVFEGVLKLAPNDALATAQLAFLRARKPVAESTELTAVRELANRSFEKGYLRDAVRYLQQLHEANPEDHATTLRLGWAYNMIKDDATALRYFELARHSSDSRVAAEAEQAWRNLRPSLRPVRTTAWVLPFHSSRWREVFAYGQVKAEFRVPGWGVRPYLSMRLIGDLGASGGRILGPAGQASPGALSESAVVSAIGLATPRRHGVMGWAEAGGSWQYFAQRNGTARMRSDYRGGVNYFRGFGAANLSNEGGWFATSTLDAVYLSRFDHNTLFYAQNRAGYHLPSRPVQIYLSLNFTTDARRMDWANYWEIGPGIRWRAPGLPAGLYLFADAVYGRHFLPGDGLRARRFTDLRTGLWYAFTY
jgi:tetratricopeptide (TPR) repeat protein